MENQNCFPVATLFPFWPKVKYCLASGCVLFPFGRNWQSAKQPENPRKKTISSLLNVNPETPAVRKSF